MYPVEDDERMREYEQYYEYAEKLYFTENNWIRAELDAEKEKDKEKLKLKNKGAERKEKSVDLSSPQIATKHQISYSEQPNK